MTDIVILREGEETEFLLEMLLRREEDASITYIILLHHGGVQVEKFATSDYEKANKKYLLLRHKYLFKKIKKEKRNETK